MPFNLEASRLGHNLDARRKLADHEREDIKLRYSQGEAIRSIARVHSHVSRRLIQFVLFPERLQAHKTIVKAEKRWRRYYNKENWKLTMRKHRARKRLLCS